MVLEFYLLLLLSYLLVLGLFVSYQLTNRWLWVSTGYTLSMFGLVGCHFKNLIVFNFTFFHLNLSLLFFNLILLLVVYGLSQINSSVGREVLWWGFAVGFYLVGPFFLFEFDKTNFYVGQDLSFWLGLLAGGSLIHDLQLLILLILILTVVSVYQSLNHYSYNYLVLLLLSSLSGLLLLVNDNLILTYLNLEFQALTLYVLTTYYRFEESQTEAGLKYLLLGSVMSGFFLLGLVVLYFVNGSLNVGELALITDSTWVLATLLFKLGSAPFYFWTPSVYQQMDYPTLLFVSSLPKVTTWYLLVVNFKCFNHSLLYYAGLASIVVGAYSGLYQLKLASLLAYSSILNSGYLLLVCNYLTSETCFLIVLYLAGYYLFVLVVVASLYTYNLSRYTLLGTFSFYYLMLSIGGLPVIPGFGFKVYLLSFVLEKSVTETVLIVGSSLFSMMYYLRVSGSYLFGQPLVNFQRPHLIYQLVLLVLGLNVVQSLTRLFF